jgi:chorismate synthase
VLPSALMSSISGTLFRISTWGESHGGAVGVVVDGCPPLLPLSEKDIQPQLDRRRPGQSALVTPRREADRVRIVSGVFEGRTTGTPVMLMVENTDARPGAYEGMKDIYRPSHADFTYDAKYGIRDWRGGGRSGARETVGRVAAGAIAEKILRLAEGIEIVAYVSMIGSIEAAPVDPLGVMREQVDATAVRCPDPEAAHRMIGAIEGVRREGDSLGGVIEAVARNVPAGLGEPVFDKLEADLAKAMLSLPACKGFENGSGFAGAAMRGSEHNDPFVPSAGAAAGASAPASEGGKVGAPSIATRGNRSGGIQGGISNGQPILIRAAFKPVATIRKPQETVDARGRPVLLEAQGRHDPCVLPRAVPLVEAMIALVLCDHWMRQISIAGASARLQRGLAAE